MFRLYCVELVYKKKVSNNPMGPSSRSKNVCRTQERPLRLRGWLHGRHLGDAFSALFLHFFCTFLHVLQMWHCGFCIFCIFSSSSGGALYVRFSLPFFLPSFLSLSLSHLLWCPWLILGNPPMTQGNPWVTQYDPWVTLDDPWVTQDDPWMTHDDPRMTP